MSKYNTEIINPDPETVYGIVLGKIRPGSQVLECGCATGYMTKYMKERLNCAVDIVEIDADSCAVAKQYANRCVMGDLETGLWKSWLAGNKYDYILFTDVLEHLRNPQNVLKNAEELMAENGRILISVPNICHNDILVRMYYNLFTYTDKGLLDDTHVHFWGAGDLWTMAEKADLLIEWLRTVRVPTQMTEQRYAGEIDPELMKILMRRPDGDVYQFVMSLMKR